MKTSAYIARASEAGMCLLFCAASLLSRTPEWGEGGVALLGLSLVFWVGLRGSVHSKAYGEDGGGGKYKVQNGKCKVQSKEPGFAFCILHFASHIRPLGRALIAGLFVWLIVSAIASPQAWIGIGQVAVTAGCVLCGVFSERACAEVRRRLAGAAVWGGACVSVVGIAEYYGLWTPAWPYPGRIVGAFTNPNDLGIYLCLLLPVGAALLLSSSGPGRRAAALAVTVLNYTGLLMSGSRGAWWAALCAGGMLAVGGWRAGLPGALSQNRRWAAALAVILAGVTVVYSVPGPFKSETAASIPDRFISSEEIAQGITRPEAVSGTSVGHRYLIWTTAWTVAAEHPIVGVGPGRFGEVYPAFRDRVLRETKRFARLEAGKRDENERYAHNDYLQMGAEAGLPGFLLFVGLILTWVGRAWRETQRGEAVEAGLLRVGFLAAAAAVLVDAVVSYPLHIPAVAVLFWAFLGMAMGKDPAP